MTVEMKKLTFAIAEIVKLNPTNKDTTPINIPIAYKGINAVIVHIIK